MCGIHASIYINSRGYLDKTNLGSSIDRRGPDYQSGIIKFEIQNGLTIEVSASILHLRGDTLQKQPMVDDNLNIFLFNGQIYYFDGLKLPESDSDTKFLFVALSKCSTKDEIIDCLRKIDGPFAVIYWNNRLRTLFYGRDIFGRKSLCRLIKPQSDDIHITSIASRDLETVGKWYEIASDSIIAKEITGSKVTTTRYKWNINAIFPSTREPDIQSIDCVDQEILIESDHLVSLNMSYMKPVEFDRDNLTQALDTLESELLQAVKTRLLFNKPHCLSCRKKSNMKCDHTKVAVAFSGGLDSTMLVLALHKILDSNEFIDLVTVAFKENSPDRLSTNSCFRELRKLIPTRSMRLVICDIDKEELVKERDSHIANLIWPCKSVIDDSIGCACWFIGRGLGRSYESSVSDQELEATFDSFTRWKPFNPEKNSYFCPATMLFIGSGIDEQLGGYSSHRAAWKRSQIEGIIDEIGFQMRRLPTRNLGRDDRTYSDHGRDVKIPFLDFKFVSFLNSLPVGLKMNLDEPLETGPKMILRQLATRWGLKTTAFRVKKAMQFGTKIANLEHSSEKGEDLCSRLVK